MSSFAPAQGAGGLTVSGTASMGVLGGDWILDRETFTIEVGPGRQVTVYGGVIDGQSEHEFHTDIDINFTMSGQTDTGLAFGASIDLDESDGNDNAGNSPAFDGRAQGGEEIFISGAFGTLTMGDTDGALDWALQEIAIGGSIGDVHTTHAGYNGNSFADDSANGGQVARYDHSFGDFAVALSANIDDDASHDDALAIGAKYSASLAVMELGVGLGYSQLVHDEVEDDAVGVSLDANFDNGFRAILNWVDMGDGRDIDTLAEQYIGLGLGYTMDDWTLAANWGKYSENRESGVDPDQSGYALVLNYDLGGGAEMQLGYSKASCEIFHGYARPVNDNTDCSNNNINGSRFSLGVAMSF